MKATPCRLGYTEYDGARYCHEHGDFLEPGIPSRLCTTARAALSSPATLAGLPNPFAGPDATGPDPFRPPPAHSRAADLRAALPADGSGT